MRSAFDLDRCSTFINCHVKPSDRPGAIPDSDHPKCAITLSRQSGCGAHVIAEKLAAYLQARSPRGAPPWTVFDRNLVEKVLEDHHLPQRIASYMTEDKVSEINDIMDELFGLHPSSWSLVQKTSETILHLAELGNVIIVGRGGNIITSKLPHVFHARIVSSLELRVERMMHFERLTEDAALERIKREDRGRDRYVKNNFSKDIHDPLLYHVVLNTDLVSLDDAARVIGDLALDRRRVSSMARSTVLAT